MLDNGHLRAHKSISIYDILSIDLIYFNDLKFEIES